MEIEKNQSLSRRIAKEIRAKARQCYKNAFRGITEHPDLWDATYIEGIAVLPCGIAIPGEHGWIEKDGEIIDPTLPDDDFLYFPALRFEGRQALCQALADIPNDSGVDLPILWRFGWGGREHPDVVRAWEAADVYAEKAALKRNEAERS